MRRTIAALALGALAVAASACGSDDDSDGSDSGGGGGVDVVASTDVWGSVVEAVGGDLVDVTSIIDDPSADPHSYEATPAQAAEIGEADLVVFNGGGYDEFIEDIVDDGIDGATVEAVSLTESADENEHVWYDLPTVRAVATEVAGVLSEADPENAQAYTANATAFGREIDAVASDIEAIRAGHTGAKVAATEPIAHYLLRAAGLEDVTPTEFVEAVEEESDPPAAAVADARKLVSERGVAVLVFNPQTETPVTEDLRDDASAAGVPVVEMTETLPADTDYLTWIRAQVQALGEALT